MPALIGESKSVPKQHFLDNLLRRLNKNEVFIFVKEDRQFYTATNMAMSIMATCIGRFGSPIKASNILKISQLGIFACWDIGKIVSELSDSGFFSRQHVGLEEYFTPNIEFFKFIEENSCEVRRNEGEVGR